MKQWKLPRKRGHKGIAGMVNGVLRSIQRQGLPSLDDDHRSHRTAFTSKRVIRNGLLRDG